MYEEEDFNYFAESLTSDNSKDRGYALGHLTAIDVKGDERLLPLLEPLLQDEHIVKMPAMPPNYCEIRWLAAKAIETQRYLLKLPPQKISRLGFVYPGSSGEMSVFAEERHGIKSSDLPKFFSTPEEPYGHIIAELEYLKTLNALPVCTMSERPYIDYSTLPQDEDDEY